MRPSNPIFVQDRKSYGSFMGHTNEAKAFREKYTEMQRTDGRCVQDSSKCKKLFDSSVSKKYGFYPLRDHQGSESGSRRNRSASRAERKREKVGKKAGKAKAVKQRIPFNFSLAAKWLSNSISTAKGDSQQHPPTALSTSLTTAFDKSGASKVLVAGYRYLFNV